MQLIVLGMHRSGTSLTARMLNLMGAYFAEAGEAMPAQQDNPKGHWERLDVMELNDRVLNAAKASWSRVSRFRIERIPAERRRELGSQAARILQRLDAHRPWMMKDPRLCLTFPIWRPLLRSPICILTYRNPLQVARSLKARNGLPLTVGLALWERYVVGALQAAKGYPKLLVLYDELMKDPVPTVARLYGELVRLGVSGLSLPPEQEIRSFIEEKLHHQRDELTDEQGYLNDPQKRLCEYFENKRIEGVEADPRCSAGALEILRFDEREAVLRERVRRRDRIVEANARRLIEVNTRRLNEANAALTLQNEALAEQGRTLRAELERANLERAEAVAELADLRGSFLGRLVQPFRLLEQGLRRLAGKPHPYLWKEWERFPLLSAEQKQRCVERWRRFRRKPGSEHAAG